MICLKGSGEMNTVTCKRCGNTWVNRIEHPRYCPKCKSFYWDVEPINKKRTEKEAITSFS